MSDMATIECQNGNTVMEGFVARPKGKGPYPAVLLFPGATGSGPTFERRVKELATLGYLAVGINVYEKGSDLSSEQAAGEHFMALLSQPDELRARVLAWAETVGSLYDVDAHRMAALGYCFGGKCVLELARGGGAVLAVAAFHGLLETHAPASPGKIKARVVAWCAGKDPYAPLEHVDAFRSEMAASQTAHQITVFSDAQHSFSDPDHHGLQPGIAYDAVADAVSWAGTLALLQMELR